ncbi:MAG: peptidylprolyl isomerase [Sulfurospirillum sp.]|nr:peptidylprolyl isomerase [Sulfurospirillum sp.]MBL0702615.1 peptidylprolyl isomerase [Sulfurospirillum sp.]
MKKIVILSLLAFVMSVNLNAKVYATVNDVKITDEDIENLLRVMPGAKYDTLQPEQQKKIIDQAIDRQLLAKEALNLGIDKDDDYKKTLESLKSDLVIQIWMKRLFEDVKVSQEDQKAYFDENSEKFVKPETIKARHIIMDDEKAAKAIIKELDSLKGEALTSKFIELAKTKSTGPSGANGGDLGWFNKKQMVEAFSKAAFGQKKGEFTKTPVKTQFGYHIILTEDKKVEEKIKFSDVKEQIEKDLKMKKFSDDVIKQVESLRKKAKIVIN